MNLGGTKMANPRDQKTLWMWILFLHIAAVSGSDQVVATNVMAVEESSPFCRRSGKSLDCNFRNTNQTVLLEHTETGIQQMKLGSLTSFRGRHQCGTNLEISSSTNITLLGLNAEENIRMEPPAGRHGITRKETRNEGKPILFPNTNEPEGSGKAADDQCTGNSYLYQSEIRLLQGSFDKVSLQSSTVQNVSGLFNNLVLKQSQIKYFLAKTVDMTVEKTFIEIIHEVNVKRHLRLEEVVVTALTEPGITFPQPLEVSGNASPVHVMKDLKIGTMKSGKLSVNGSRLFMDRVTISEVGAGAISIEAGGEATLNNTMIEQGPAFCLVIRGSGQVILNNFTLGDRIIEHLHIITKSEWPVYPLMSHKSPQKSNVRITPLKNDTVDGDNAGDVQFISLDWYWVPIMTAVGLVSGMVIACAVRCGTRPKRNTEMLSSLSFSELVARERQGGGRDLEEGEGISCSNNIMNEHVEYDVPRRPDLVRQDSGLTSSSFASYTACSSDRRPSSVRHVEDFENALIHTQDPNVFIHVPSVACTRESVIYEECEALPPTPKEENLYVTMK